MPIPQPPTGASDGELVRWTFEVLNAHDVAVMRTMWTNATVERFPSHTVHGADGTAAYFETRFTALPDLSVQVAADGDDVFVQWHLTGTHTGAPFEGVEATGRALAIDGMDHFVIRDGTVATNFVIFDRCSSRARAACCPPTGSRGDRATKAAFDAKTRLLARLRRRR